jgi:hypothetical protein
LGLLKKHHDFLCKPFGLNEKTCLSCFNPSILGLSLTGWYTITSGNARGIKSPGGVIQIRNAGNNVLSRIITPPAIPVVLISG